MGNLTIPVAVKEEAKTLISMYGENIILLGQKNNMDVYRFMFPEDSVTGFPFIYLYDREKESAVKITGFKAVSIICELVKE